MAVTDEEQRREALRVMQKMAREARDSGLPPGFPRRWPACAGPMRVIAQHLLGLGATGDEIASALRRDFPDMPDLPDVPVPAGEQTPPVDPTLRRPAAAWRRDAWWESVAHQEIVRVLRHPVLGQQPDPEGYGGGDAVPEAWYGPADHETALVASADDLLQLCAFFDIYITLEEDGGTLRLSRPIPGDGALRDQVAAYKPELVAALRLVGAGATL